MSEARRIAKLRRIAQHIRSNRQYLSFDLYNPDFSSFTQTRGSIPWRLWRNKQWLDTHLVMPVIRERLKWPVGKLAYTALPRMQPFIQEAMAPKWEAQRVEWAATEEARIKSERSALHIRMRIAHYKKPRY